MTGGQLHDLVGRLVDIPRSLTGDGVRATLAVLQEHAPFEVHEVASGTVVHDWEVPLEWNCRSATLTAPDGTVLADWDASPLQVVGYSEPVDVEVDLDELVGHLHSLPDQPDAVPYRTSYYVRDWGFCLPHAVREGLQPGTYRATIDADLSPGHLSYAELVLPGDTDEVVLLTTHTCHPAMANDNASGMAVLAALAADLHGRTARRHTFHLLAAPGTIGALTWLAHNEDVAGRVVAGVTLAGMGDDGPLHWKRTFAGDAWVDLAAEHVLTQHGGTVEDFGPWGYDERQFNSPGYRLPVGRLGRTPHGTYPEYHTSLDDLDFVSPDSLEGSLQALTQVIDVLEHDRRVRNLRPHGEPRLGPRGLYPSVGGQAAQQEVLAMLWVLAMADGDHTLLETARRSGLSFQEVDRAARTLAGTDLLEDPL